MTYREAMAECLRYIEEHLDDEELSPRGLAALCGYSFHHFCHVFTVCNDVAVGEYIRRRRLARAGEKLRAGGSVTTVAFDAGFDTVSGFSRAFKKEFGVCASAYGKNKNGGISAMKVIFEKKAAFKAVGYEFIPDTEVQAKENGAYWLGKDFSAVSKEDFARLAQGEGPEVGLWTHPAESGKLSYFFGPIVEDFSFVPKGAAKMEIPAAEYAVFTSEPADLAGDVNAFAAAVRKCWKYIYTEWLDNNEEYVYDHTGMAFEYYDSKKGCEGNNASVMNIYVPVKRK